MSDKKLLLLDVAEELFSMHGFDGTSTRMIADKADMNIAMLSYYFGSKENLLKEILDRFAEDTNKMVSRIEKEEADPLARLKRLINSYIDYVFENPRPVVIAYREINIVSKKRDLFGNTLEAIRRVRLQFKDILDDGQQKKVFRPFDSMMMLVTLSATVDNLIIESRTLRENFVEQDSEHHHQAYPFVDENTQQYSDAFKQRTKQHLDNLIDHVISAG